MKFDYIDPKVDEIPFDETLKINEHNRQEERKHKVNLINSFFAINLKTKRKVNISDVERLKNPVIIDDRFIFFFTGSTDHLQLKTVLKRKNMKRRCSWLCNGQAGTNTEQVYTSKTLNSKEQTP